MVADFAAIVKQAGEDYSPSFIANYTYDLVKEYNQFYHDFSILREENEAVKIFRLALSENVAKVVRLGCLLYTSQKEKHPTSGAGLSAFQPEFPAWRGIC